MSYVTLTLYTEALSWMGAVESNEMSPSYCLAKSFSLDTIEAHAYYIFDKIMVELGPLYDPTHGPDGVPPVVSFCARTQGYLIYTPCSICIFDTVIHISIY